MPREPETISLIGWSTNTSDSLQDRIIDCVVSHYLSGIPIWKYRVASLIGERRRSPQNVLNKIEELEKPRILRIEKRDGSELLEPTIKGLMICYGNGLDYCLSHPNEPPDAVDERLFRLAVLLRPHLDRTMQVTSQRINWGVDFYRSLDGDVWKKFLHNTPVPKGVTREHDIMTKALQLVLIWAWAYEKRDGIVKDPQKLWEGILAQVSDHIQKVKPKYPLRIDPRIRHGLLERRPDSEKGARAK